MKSINNIDLREHIFQRSSVARIIGISPQTIANREKSGLYPEAHRDVNNYRKYNIVDVMRLQLQSHGSINVIPISDELYEMGYTDPREVLQFLDRVVYQITN